MFKHFKSFIFLFCVLLAASSGVFAEYDRASSEEAIGNSLSKLRGVLDANRFCHASKSLKRTLFGATTRFAELVGTEDISEQITHLDALLNDVFEMSEAMDNEVDRLNPFCDRERIEKAIARLSSDIENYRNSLAPGMSDEAFEELIEQLESESWDKGRVTVMRSAARYNLFTVEQIIRIFKTYTWDDGRLETAELLKDRIVDQQYLYKLYDTMTWDRNKEKLREILEPQQS